MRVESVGYQGSIADAIEQATEAEESGFDTWWATETKSDVFLSAAAAAANTGSIRVGTGIAVALARNPMLVAVQANDIQAFSGGRFSLGLGAQIKPHVERRFSMEYSSPAVSVISGPTAASCTGGLPCGLGPGSNIGVMRVWV